MRVATALSHYLTPAATHHPEVMQVQPPERVRAYNERRDAAAPEHLPVAHVYEGELIAKAYAPTGIAPLERALLDARAVEPPAAPATATHAVPAAIAAYLHHSSSIPEYLAGSVIDAYV